MSSSAYGYDYLPLATNRRRNHLWIFASGLALLVIVNFLVLRCLRAPPSAYGAFQPLNEISPVHEGILAGNGSDPALLVAPSPEERAVVTTLYSESFVNAVLTLGRSLQDTKTSARRVLLYFPERLSDRSLCQLRAGGWELQPITRIAPPNGGKGVHHRFLDQYSKLQLWTLDTLGIKSVVYLDGDMLVQQNFDELWALPYEFAAVPDVYSDNRGFVLSFNAGMMLLRTSSDIFNDMLSKIESAKYRRLDAEQGFLNAYFASQVVRLPYVYNANLVIKQRSPVLWRAIEKDMRVVHYTMMKPFIDEERKQAIGGLWEAELEQWDAVWENVSRELREKC